MGRNPNSPTVRFYRYKLVTPGHYSNWYYKKEGDQWFILYHQADICGPVTQCPADKWHNYSMDSDYSVAELEGWVRIGQLEEIHGT